MAKQYIVVEDIDAVMQVGLPVYDASGAKIGSVQDYSTVAGYLVVRTGLVTHQQFYVPYSAIKSIDPHEVYLKLYEGTVASDHSAPPPARIVVEGNTATTVVPSGYDGSRVEFNRVSLDMVGRDLARGMAVYATSGEKVGTVDGIDDRAGYMVVKPHHFSQKALFIPVAAINAIEPEFGEVFLAVSRDVVLKDFARLPEEVVLRIDMEGSTGEVIGTAVIEQPGARR